MRGVNLELLSSKGRFCWIGLILVSIGVAGCEGRSTKREDPMSSSNSNNAVDTQNVSPTNEIPALELLGDAEMILDVGMVFLDPGFRASDKEDGDLNSKVIVSSNLDTSVLGPYTIEYRVSDSAGAQAPIQRRSVRVVDRIAPTITLFGNSLFLVEAGGAFVEPGFQVFDNYEDNLYTQVEVSGTVNTNILGENVLTYKVSDSSGNAANSRTRIVSIVDRVPPMLTLQGANPLTIEAGTVYAEPGFQAIDSFEGDISNGVLTIMPQANWQSRPGSYQITYETKDSSNNVTTRVRNVSVVDRTPPEITLNGNAVIELRQYEPYVELGASAVDNIDGDITSSIIIRPPHAPIDTSRTPRSFTVFYQVSDMAGNYSAVARKINVSPMKICTAAELDNLRNYENYDADLTCDIDLAGVNFEPIRTYRGNLNGNGHTISNLSLRFPGRDQVGLFGLKYWGSITNLTLRNIRSSGRSYVGSLAAYITNTTLSNIQVLDSEISGSYSVGGIVGHSAGGRFDRLRVANSNIKIMPGELPGFENIRAAGIGGIFGYASHSELTNSLSKVDISSEEDEYKVWSVGGIVGALDSGAISDSKFDGNIYLQRLQAELIGGIVGSYASERGKLHRVQSFGFVGGENNVGGIAGSICGRHPHPGSPFTECELNEAYSAAIIEAAGGHAGGLIGQMDRYSRIKSSGFNGDVSGLVAGGLAGYTDNGVEISDSFAGGHVSGDYAGGIIGNLSWSWVFGPAVPATIRHSFSFSRMDFSRGVQFGLAGSDDEFLESFVIVPSDSASYWNVSVNPELAPTADVFQGTSLTEVQMRDPERFRRAGFRETIWRLRDGFYPELLWLQLE